MTLLCAPEAASRYAMIKRLETGPLRPFGQVS